MLETPRLAPFNVEFLLNEGTSHLNSKGEPSRPSEETHFSHLCPQSDFCPGLVNIDEGRDVDQQLHIHTHLSVHHNRAVQCPNFEANRT